jgi:hypothetical protein
MGATAADHAKDIEHAADKAAEKAATAIDFWLENLPVEAKKAAYELAAKKLADDAKSL